MRKPTSILQIFFTSLAVLFAVIYIVEISSQPANADTAWYTLFSDDFNRANSATIGNEWQNSSGNAAISANQLLQTTSSTTGIAQNPSLQVCRPTSQASLDSRVTVDIPKGYSNANVGASIRTSSNGQNAYIIALDNSSNGLRLGARINGSNSWYGTNIPGSSINLAHDLRLTLSVEGGTGIATVTAELYDIDTSTTIGALSYTDNADALKSAGTACLYTYTSSRSKIFDNFVLEVPPVEFSATPDAENIEFGNSITYTFTDDEDVTINNFSDAGAGGTFSTNSVALNSDNSHTSTMTYTPARPGAAVITADVSNDGIFEREIFVSPYSTKIGFIGDSITYGSHATNPATDAAPATAASYLGSGFTFINRGISSQTTTNWANNNCTGGTTTCLSDAIVAFQSSGVDIVQIMLGTNDVKISQRISAETYHDNLQSIIDQLKEVGIKRVILSRPIYFGLQNNSDRDQQSLDTLTTDFYQTLQDLEAENHGFVLMGDTQAHDWFKDNFDYAGSAGIYYDDHTHPTSLGYDKLGEFWASAIKVNLLAEATPAKNWLDGESYFTAGQSGTLAFSIEKYLEDFENVTVNGNTLTVDTDYTVMNGSTVIQLTSQYLSSLSPGTYTLGANFFGGVTASSSFTILDAANSMPQSNLPGAPNTGLAYQGMVPLIVAGITGIIIVGTVVSPIRQKIYDTLLNLSKK